MCDIRVFRGIVSGGNSAIICNVFSTERKSKHIELFLNNQSVINQTHPRHNCFVSLRMFFLAAWLAVSSES